MESFGSVWKRDGDGSKAVVGRTERTCIFKRDMEGKTSDLEDWIWEM